METDFGEGLEHIKSIVCDGIMMINVGYMYGSQETVKILILDVKSGV